jgi:hypothetical protein
LIGSAPKCFSFARSPVPGPSAPSGLCSHKHRSVICQFSGRASERRSGLIFHQQVQCCSRTVHAARICLFASVSLCVHLVWFMAEFASHRSSVLPAHCLGVRSSISGLASTARSLAAVFWFCTGLVFVLRRLCQIAAGCLRSHRWGQARSSVCLSGGDFPHGFLSGSCAQARQRHITRLGVSGEMNSIPALIFPVCFSATRLVQESVPVLLLSRGIKRLSFPSFHRDLVLIS